MARILSPQAQASDDQTIARGVALHRAGRFRQAEACYQAVLAHDPENAEALNSMGALSIEARQPNLAIDFFERALRHNPTDFRFLNNLGNVLMDCGRTEEGLPHLEAALRIKPNSYELLVNIGRAYRKMGVAERGVPLLKRAVAMRPAVEPGLMVLADSLVALNQYDEAQRIYRKLIKRPAPPPDAFYGLAMSGKQTAEDNLAAPIADALKQPRLTSKGKTSLHYAAAKVHTDLKEVDAAWSHLLAANAGLAGSFNFPRHEARQQAMIGIFHSSFVTSRRDFGAPSQLPVFIFGMPRSGTSLTEQILSSHSQVFGAGELNYMHTLANQLFYGVADLEVFADQVRGLTPDAVKRLADGYLAKLGYFSTSAERITDKMPHNFALLGLIALLFPRARLVYCKRNGLDNCFSIFSNQLNEAHSYGSDLETLGRYYRGHVALMDHWKAVLGDQIMEVEYEALVQDTEGTSRRLVDFVGLPWNDACMRFFENDRAVSTISKWQVRQPIYKSSVTRWKPYEKFLEPLRRGLGDLAEDTR